MGCIEVVDWQGNHEASTVFRAIGVFEASCGLLLICLGLRCICEEVIGGDVFREEWFMRMLAMIFSIVRS
jgi:anthranilate/para-aminobenzoate synthase component II